MDDVARRRARLLGLLPRILAAQSGDSPVGALIQVMANMLGRLDRDQRRVMRDHWVQLAGCDDRQEGVGAIRPHGALAELGRLLDLPPMPWEDCEAYRRRLIASATILRQGLTSPDALTGMAAAAVGWTCCPKSRRLPAEQPDTTVVVALPYAVKAHCPACDGPESNPCPLAEAQGLELALTDNPLTRRQWRRRGVQDGDPLADLSNPSLCPDRPSLKITALGDGLRFPAVENRATREVVLYAGNLAAGESLTLESSLSTEELKPFRTHEPITHHQGLLPGGRARLVTADGRVSDVAERVYYLSGFAFEDPSRPDRPDDSSQRVRFAGPGDDQPRFGSFDKTVRTPRLRNHADTWLFRIFTRDRLRGAAGVAAQKLLDEAPEGASGTSADLRLRWWARPPASFRLRVPKAGPVATVLARRDLDGNKFLEFIRQTVESARAAGVDARVSFPEPSRRESLTPGVRWQFEVEQTIREPLSPAAPAPALALTARQRESHAAGEGHLSLLGVFDVTRLDWSHVGGEK